MTDSLVSRDGADTESYTMHSNRVGRIDPSTSPRALMGDALISAAPASEDAPTPKPVIPPEVIEQNLRRVKAGAKNTLITVNADGTRSYKHDLVNRGDRTTDTLRTDRGEGTRDSLDLLSKEGKVKVAGLLDRTARGSDGRFTKEA